MDISVVIPVYNGESVIKESINQLRNYLQMCFHSYEIIVVNDGSTDNTRAILDALPKKNLHILSMERNKGKYDAIKAGMAASKGTCRIFTDADLPYELETIGYMANLINEQHIHIVIGDRTSLDSEYFVYLPFIRNLATKLFSLYISLFVTGKFLDTQCGLKAFRSDVAEALFPLLHEQRFAGDVELLYIALKYNLEIRRIPVRLKRIGPSTVQLLPHALSMLRRVLSFKRNWRHGLYDSKELSRISSLAYWKDPKQAKNI